MKCKAYLTIYLALSLTALLSVVMVLVAGVKKNTVRMEEELALNTAGWSALAEYHQELFRQYDLFFLDTSYGSENPETEAVGRHVKDYVDKNLQNTCLIQSHLAAIEIREAEAATDNGGQVLKRQIAEYEENYFGIEGLEKLFSEYDFSEIDLIDEEELIIMRDDNEERLANEPPPVKRETRKRYNLKTGETTTYEVEEEVPIENPASLVNELRNKGILNLVVEDTAKISGSEVSLNQYLSYRNDILQGTGILPDREEERNALTELKEDILLQAYIFQKYGYYGREKENAGLDYQVEYLLAGKSSDVENLKAVVNKLLLFREAANAAYLYGDAAKRAEISAMAASVAAVAIAPYLQPMLETSILFAWAYIESIQDVKLLLAGGKVPIMKSASDWRTGLSGILDISGGAIDKNMSRGLDYRQYLSMFLVPKKENELLFSMMDVMEMDIRRTAYNENFRMDGCISGFKAVTEFADDSGNCSFIRIYYY